jgi:hypothetical protein
VAQKSIKANNEQTDAHNQFYLCNLSGNQTHPPRAVDNGRGRSLEIVCSSGKDKNSSQAFSG